MNIMELFFRASLNWNEAALKCRDYNATLMMGKTGELLNLDTIRDIFIRMGWGLMSSHTWFLGLTQKVG